MSVHSDAVPLSSPRCFVRSCRLGSSVSLHLSCSASQSPARDVGQLDAGGLEGLRQCSPVLNYSMSLPSILPGHNDHGCCVV